MTTYIRPRRAQYFYTDGCKHPYEWKACPTCGESKMIQKRRTHCSYRCSKWEALNPQWKGHAAKPTTARLRAHRRFTPDVCRRCGTTDALHRHHVDRDTYNNSPENIQFLCASCHVKLHYVEDGTFGVWARQDAGR